jgi:hypothetical protein
MILIDSRVASVEEKAPCMLLPCCLGDSLMLPEREA